MNDRESESRDSDTRDPILEAMLLPLKDVLPSEQGRLNTRMALAAELGRQQAARQRRELPWWRRKVSLPVPLAAALVLMAALAVPLAIGAWLGELPAWVPTAKESPRGAGQDDVQRLAIDKASGAEPAGLYETETYLCGVGRIRLESRVVVKE